MRAAYAAGVILIALASCSPGSPQPSTLEKEAREALELALNDAPSARLRDVKTASAQINGSQTIICGLVNAKDQMGAFVGWRRFFFQTGAKAALISPDASDDSPRGEQAAQAVFESIYGETGCPSTAYEPSLEIHGAVRAIVAGHNTKR